MRRLRQVRGILPGGRGTPWPEALRQARKHRGISEARAAARPQVGRGALGSRLPRQQPQKLLRQGHRAVQDGLPGACRRTGLSEAGRAGQISGGAGAHQEGQSLPCRLRPHLQQALRGGLHARDHRSGRLHRRGQEIPRRAGSSRGNALYSARRRGVQPSDRLGAEDRHHRRRPGGPVRGLLSGHARL